MEGSLHEVDSCEHRERCGEMSSSVAPVAPVRSLMSAANAIIAALSVDKEGGEARSLSPMSEHFPWSLERRALLQLTPPDRVMLPHPRSVAALPYPEE